MNMITFKKQLMLFMFLLLCGTVSYAADEDLITKQITIKLDEAGTLSDKIGSSKRDKITNLKIEGEMNDDDFGAIRDMKCLAVLDLSEIKIKDDYLPDFAFWGCSGLTSLSIPSGVTSIGDGAFWDCSDLTSLSIPSSVTTIGIRAFYGCSGLTSLSIPSGVTFIGESAFYGCSGLTSLSIPSGVTSIGNGAFCGCSGLTSLSIPSSVTTIGISAFLGCSGLTSLSIPSGVTSIGNSAFYGCSGLTSIDLPSTVTSIGKSAFGRCSSLASIDIPSSVTSIGESAFEYCRSLTSVYVSWQSPISADFAFSGVDISKCTLYVPQGTVELYLKVYGWNTFGHIEEYDPTGIDKVTTSNEAKEVSRYSVNGQRLSVPTKGLNIVKYSDGSVKKVVLK